MTITTLPNAPLFVVIGATGAQGGSVVQSLKASSRSYRVRAITRDVEKASAKALAELGCEVVQADADNQESLEKAFEGADVVFGMTASDYASKDTEHKKGKLQVDAAKAKGVKLFIWSSELHIGELSGGKTNVQLFDVKAEVARYARSISLPILEVNPGTFATNFITQNVPRKLPNSDTYALTLPADADTKLPIIDIESDFGKYVVDTYEKSPHRSEPVLAAKEYVTAEKVAELIAEVSGQKVIFNGVPAEAFQTRLAQIAGPDVARSVVEMYTGFVVVGYYGGRDLTESNALLSTPAKSFKEFLEAHKEQLLKVMGL